MLLAPKALHEYSMRGLLQEGSTRRRVYPKTGLQHSFFTKQQRISEHLAAAQRPPLPKQNGRPLMAVLAMYCNMLAMSCNKRP